MQRSRTIAVIVIIALLAYAYVRFHHPFRTFTRPPTTGACDAALWDHVYHPQRLAIHDPCKTVTGTIVSIRQEDDGDLHVRLAVDDSSLLNERNTSGQHGGLVVEPVCAAPVHQPDAMEACRGYSSPLEIPPAGSRVRVTGAFVTDLDHGWNEIHPVTSIEILR